jgi:hypothetical protein
MKKASSETDPSHETQKIDPELYDVTRVISEIGFKDFERVCIQLRGYLIPETLRQTIWAYRFLSRGQKEHPLTLMMTKELARKGT